MNSIQEQQIGEKDRSSLAILQDNQQQEILLEEVPDEVREGLRHAMHAPAAPSTDTSRELHEISSHTSKILPDESKSAQENKQQFPYSRKSSHSRQRANNWQKNKAEIATNLIAQRRGEQGKYRNFQSQNKPIPHVREPPRKMMMRDIPPHML
ncbi:hypothetical protein GYMLUDRAFT_59345 [Collybiopsis luxurians FD-317 M1]|uniref:Uncharacterized protein n=1 Tax=Collybiopsis luxurians FD-317 M1 TaxID=944289 RepID=A0A0D0CP02_9AGAR|nr:hypothetical protein GYMLUDRAFT_59345 [Collybiopsis luxurians FD-317 M1]